MAGLGKIVFSTLLLVSYIMIVEGISSKGSEFYILFGPNKGSEYGPKLLVTTTETETVNFWVAWNRRQSLPQPIQANMSYTVTSDETVQIEVPEELEMNENPFNIRDKAIIIQTAGGKEVTVIGVSEEAASTDAFLALPKITTKNNQYVYYGVSTAHSSLATVASTVSFFGFVVTEDDTDIRISTPVALSGVWSNRILKANQMRRERGLAKGTSVSFTASTDLTGVKVESNKPLTFTSGHQCGNVPIDVTACDHMVENIPPAITWGQRFFLTPLSTRTGGDGYRILASNDNTECSLFCNKRSGSSIDAEAINLAQEGDYHAFISASDNFCSLECNLPVLVVMFSLSHSFDGISKSDPFMVLVPPVEQYYNNFNLPFFSSVAKDTRDEDVVFTPWINIIVPVEYLRSGIRFDGTPLQGARFYPILCSDGEICAYATQYNPNTQSGSHVLSHTDPNAKISAITYAWERENTYGYVPGMRLDSIAASIFCFKNTEREIFEVTGELVLTATRTGPVGAVVCIKFSVTDISTQGSADYKTSNGECCFEVGSNEASCTPIELEVDDTTEEDEQFQVSLDPTSVQCVCEEGSNVTVTVIDETPTTPPPNIIAFERPTYETNETIGNYSEIRLQAVQPFQEDTEVTITFSDITATGGSSLSTLGVDYISDSVTVTFLAGQRFSTFASIPIKDDGIFEGSENFIAAFDLPTDRDNIQKGSPSEANVSIIEFNTIAFERGTYEATETVGNYSEIRLQAAQPFQEDTEVTITFSDITATGGSSLSTLGVDYISDSVTVTFLAGQRFSTFASIPIRDDGIFEGSENFIATFDLPTDRDNIQKGSPSEANVSIIEFNTIAFERGTYEATETVGNYSEIRLQAAQSFQEDTEVTITFSDITATGGSSLSTLGVDYISDSVTVTFLAGQRFSTFASIPIRDDGIFEGSENFIATFDRPIDIDNIQKGSPSEANVSIIEFNTIAFERGTYEATETVGNYSEIRLQAVQPFQEDTEVTITFSDITATGGSSLSTLGVDYISDSVTVTFLAGQRFSTFASIPIKDDGIFEGSENFIAAFDLPTDRDNIQKGSPSEANVSIIEFNTIAFERGTYEATETVGNYSEIRLQAVQPFQEDTEVTITFSDITATGGSSLSTLGVDYISDSVTVTFLAGQRFSTFASIPIKDDGIFERSENFIATFDLPTDRDNIQKGSPSEANVSIIEEQQNVTVNFSPIVYSVNETEGFVTLTLIASSAVAQDYDVIVFTADGTAIDGDDYTSQSGGYLGTFTANSVTSQVRVPILNDDIPELIEDFIVTLSIPSSSGSLGVTAGSDDIAFITISDDDLVEVNFHPTEYTVNEGDGSVILTLVSSGPASKEYTVTVDTTDKTATGGTDYTSGGFTVTFPAGSTSAQLAINIFNDNIVEVVERFCAEIVNITSDFDVTRGSNSTAGIDIEDNDAIEINFDPVVYNVQEGSDAVLVAVATKPASFNYTITVQTEDGSATSTEDYAGNTYQVTFIAGSTTARIPIATSQDNVIEGDEVFFANLIIPSETSAIDISAGNNNRSTVNILEVGDIQVNFDPTEYSVNEGDGSVILTLVSSDPASKEYTVTVDTTDKTATGGTDYTSGGYTVTFPAGSTSAQLAINIFNDNIVEVVERFCAEIVNITSDLDVTRGSNSTAGIDIEDNDAIEINFDPVVYNVPEGSDSVLVAVATKPASFNYTITVQTEDGSATSTEDYAGNTYQVTFIAGSTTARIPIATSQDNVIEGDEVFFANLIIPSETSAIDISAGNNNRSTVNILEVGDIQVNFDPTEYSVNEGDGSVILTLVSSDPASKEYTVTVDTTDKTATGGTDYTSGGYTVTFPAGSTSAQLAINIFNDNIVEVVERFCAEIVNITSDLDVTRGSNSTAGIDIEDNDAIEINFDPVVYNVPEGSDAILVAVATKPASFNYTITVQTEDGSATSTEDYAGNTYQVTFIAGSTTARIPIATSQDNVIEGDEVFFANLIIPSETSALDISAGNNNRSTVNILEVGDIQVNFDPTEYTVNEGDGSVILTLVSSGPASKEYTVTVDTTDKTATGGTDYTSGGFTVTFPAGSTSAQLAINILDDNLAEVVERFCAEIVSLTSDLDVTRGSNSTAGIDIEDNDAIEINFDPVVYNVQEGSDAVLVAVATKPASFNYTITVQTEDGSATSTEDYAGNTYQVTFIAGSTTARIPIATSQDNVTEGDEVFFANLIISSETFALDISAGNNNRSTVNILEVGDIQVNFDPTEYSVNEGDGSVILTLVSSGPASKEYTVTVDTTDKTATGGTDYTSGGYTVTFPAGSTSAQLAINIFNDNIVEVIERFCAEIVNITSDLDVTRGSNSTAGIDIEDNDAIEINFDPVVYNVQEGSDTVLVAVATKPASFNYTITVQTEDGSATSTEDYAGNTYQVTFIAGSTTARIPIATSQDNVIEGDEVFFANLIIPSETSALDISAGNNNRSTVNILEVGDIQVNFDPTEYSVNEGDGSVILTLVSSGPASKEYTVTVDTTDKTATGGTDYTSGGFTVTFPAGSTSAQLAINILDDNLAEVVERFCAEIVNITSDLDVTRGSNSTAGIDIEDNDPIEVNVNPTQYIINENRGSVIITLVSNGPAAEDYTVIVDTSDGKATTDIDFMSGGYIATFTAGNTAAMVAIPINNDDIAELDEDFTVTLSVPSSSASPGVTVGSDDTANITITDDDAISIEFSPIEYSVSESDGKVVLMLMSNRTASFDYTVEVNTFDGIATGSIDFTAGPYNVTFPAGTNKTNLEITILNDDIYESGIGPEDFTAVVTIPSGIRDFPLIIGNDDTAVIKVADDESLMINFNPVIYEVGEGDRTVTVRLIADKDFQYPFIVPVNTTDGSATASDDYSSGGYIALFVPGNRNSTITIPIESDTVQEGPEDFFANIVLTDEQLAMLIFPGPQDMANITIVEAPSVQFDQIMYTVNESTGEVILKLRASGTLDSPYVVQVQTFDGTAKTLTDYSGGVYEVEFPSGSTMATVSISITDDNLCEILESFSTIIIIPQAASNLGITKGPQDEASIQIKDDDDVEVNFVPTSYTHSETDGFATLTAVASGVCDYNYSLLVNTSDGTAKSPGDYVSGTYEVTFTSGSTSSNVLVPISDDSVNEDAENFTATLITPEKLEGVSIGDDGTAIVDILDDDEIFVNFNPITYSVSEDGNEIVLILEANVPSDTLYTITVQTRNGSAESPGDYEGGSFTVTFEPGETIAMVTIPINDDEETCECEEDFFAEMTIPDSAAERGIQEGENRTSTIFISDNDDCIIAFAPNPQTVTEGDGTVEVCLRIDRNCIGDFEVLIKTRDGSNNQTAAKAFSDYIPSNISSYVVEFRTGENEACTNIPIEDDDIFEGDEYFESFIEIPPNVDITPGRDLNVTISDNDPPPMCLFDGEDVRVNEIEGEVMVSIRVGGSNFERTFSCSVETIPQSAEENTDFVPEIVEVIFEPGEEDITKEVLIELITDDNPEEPELFQLQISPVVPSGPGPEPIPQFINITVIDAMPEEIMCRLMDSLRIAHFRQMLGPSGYPFERTCEHSLITSCGNETIPFKVNIDVQGGDIDESQLAIQWNDSILIINDDNSVNFTSIALDGVDISEVDNGSTIVIVIEEIGFKLERRLSPQGFVSLALKNTSIVLDQLCGLCGNQNGQLVLMDGRTVGLEEVEEFLTEYRVPTPQLLIPTRVRSECSDMRNDTIIGDPLYEVPLKISKEFEEEIGGEVSLCYEVHGKANRMFNLISDKCVSVNAHYAEEEDLQGKLNVIDQVGILSEDNNDMCHQIQVDLDGCKASVDGNMVLSSYSEAGVRVDRRTKRVRVAVPNCDNVDLVMWIICQNFNGVPMIKFMVARGLNLRPTSHGIIGQFWNVDVTAERYTLTAKDNLAPSDKHYAVAIMAPDGSMKRRFFALLHWATWDSTKKNCLYAGSGQGARIKGVKSLNGTVIEGRYWQYMVDGLFEYSYNFGRFTAPSCMVTPSP